MASLEALAEALAGLDGAPVRLAGTVREATATERSIDGLSRHARLGDQLRIAHTDGTALAEVIRIDADTLIAAPYEWSRGAFLGAKATLEGPLTLHPHDGWLGRVVDGLGRPIDGRGRLAKGPGRPADAPPPPALSRPLLTTPLPTGVKVVDLFAPLVEGQRVGIFAGSGVGKSTLLGMIARASAFDVVVLGLVGERGREVNELLTGPLGPARPRTVAVVSTGDETAMMRRLAPLTAMTVAEHFRDEGKRVLLLLDSLTRVAHANRDVALSSGELPVSRGYPPSTFAELTRLVERAGAMDGAGSITGLFTVLVDAEDMDEPVADAARGTLDGHIVMQRALAEAGRFPAVDPLASLSRLADRAFAPDELALSQRLRALIARFEDTRDVRLLSGHKPGHDADLDRAVTLVPKVYRALQQRPDERPARDAFAELAAVLTAAEPTDGTGELPA